jgi:hypothetical protein
MSVLKKLFCSSPSARLFVVLTTEPAMPPCVLKDDCLFPILSLREGHQCPGCSGLVHALCGVEDPNCYDLHANVTCFACAGLLGIKLPVPPEVVIADPVEPEDVIVESPKMKEKSTQEKSTPKKRNTKRAGNSSPTARRKSPPGKKHKEAAALVPTK